MLWGLEVPRDLESIFCTPATSSIAFTAPPAITPVPSDAGLRRTSPAPALPTTGRCILPVLVRGILIRFFRALSNPFWMASETSFALPSPRSEEHTSELQSRGHLVCRLLLEKKKKKIISSILTD